MATLAAQQHGRVRYDQLLAVGLSKSALGRWASSGYLYRELPRVYAVGHPGRSTESDLAAALLYAGPGASLTHGTGVWWRGLLRYPPQRIIVSTPRRVRSIGNIEVHTRREHPRVIHNGFPIAPVPQLMLDYAATGRRDLLRLVLATADYEGILDVPAIQALTGRGIAGSAALQAALQIHLPLLARARGRNELLLLELFETQGVPMPDDMNLYVGRWLVDAVWYAARLIVEIDDRRGHHSPAQLHENHQRDLEHRQAG